MSEPSMVSASDRLILIVDDDDNVRSLLAMTTEMEGFKVKTAHDGNDAASLIKDKAPDLIITDLMMSGQGGYEFLRGLHESGNGKIPVIVITGSRLDKTTVDLIRQESNVIEFVTKPIQVSTFMTLLHKHLKTAPPGTSHKKQL